MSRKGRWCLSGMQAGRAVDTAAVGAHSGASVPLFACLSVSFAMAWLILSSSSRIAVLAQVIGPALLALCLRAKRVANLLLPPLAQPESPVDAGSASGGTHNIAGAGGAGDGDDARLAGLLQVAASFATHQASYLSIHLFLDLYLEIVVSPARIDLLRDLAFALVSGSLLKLKNSNPSLPDHPEKPAGNNLYILDTLAIRPAATPDHSSNQEMVAALVSYTHVKVTLLGLLGLL